jgi:hypothetical protein
MSSQKRESNSSIDVWVVKDERRNTYFRFTPIELDFGWVRDPNRATLFESRQIATNVVSRCDRSCYIEPRRVACRSLARQYAREYLSPRRLHGNAFIDRLEKIVVDLKSLSRDPEKITDEAILIDSIVFGLECCLGSPDATISIPGIWEQSGAWASIISCGMDQFEEEIGVHKAKAVDDRMKPESGASCSTVD